MSIILTPTNRNQRRAEKGNQGDEAPHEVAFGPENVHLSCQEEGEETEARECEAGVPGGEGAPAVVKDVVVGLCAYFY